MISRLESTGRTICNPADLKAGRTEVMQGKNTNTGGKCAECVEAQSNITDRYCSTEPRVLSARTFAWWGCPLINARRMYRVMSARLRIVSVFGVVGRPPACLVPPPILLLASLMSPFLSPNRRRLDAYKYSQLFINSETMRTVSASSFPLVLVSRMFYFSNPYFGEVDSYVNGSPGFISQQ